MTQIKRSDKKGMLPGSLVHIGEKKSIFSTLEKIRYNTENIEVLPNVKSDDCSPEGSMDYISWVNMDGLSETSILEGIGKNFSLHSLILEDILNTEQRPKIDDFGDYIFIVLRSIFPVSPQDKNHFDTDQISIVLGNNYVFTTQEVKSDIFDSIKERLVNYKGKIRTRGSDYLAYAMIDSVVDTYFLILDKLLESINTIEMELIENPKPSTLESIHLLKRELIFLRKNIWPLREVLVYMDRNETGIIKDTTKPFLRDVHDHIIQVLDTIEAYRDITSGMLDVYISSVSNKLNEAIKVLTILSIIFMPLTFIAGVYGMNFKNMPELNWHYGYFYVLGFMGVLVSFLMLAFKKKKWI